MRHKITHFYQPTNTSCGPTSAAMLVSHFGLDISPEQAIKEIPVVHDEKGKDMGTTGQHIAQWLVSKGFKVDLYSADFQTLDLSWQGLEQKELLKKLVEILDIRDIPAMGKEWSKLYVDAYIKLIEAGGRVYVHQYISSELLSKLLKTGPVLTTVNYSVLYNTGRTRNEGLRKDVSDAKNGKIMNHFNILIGETESFYFISDPWKEPGQHKIKKELFIASVQAAQMECDNLVIQIQDKK